MILEHENVHIYRLLRGCKEKGTKHVSNGFSTRGGGGWNPSNMVKNECKILKNVVDNRVNTSNIIIL
jgi:hypothetical protein